MAPTLRSPAGRLDARQLGILRVGGDWACAHGDFAALRDVARQLAVVAREPLHGELEVLVTACLARPQRAAELWRELRDRLSVAMPR